MEGDGVHGRQCPDAADQDGQSLVIILRSMLQYIAVVAAVVYKNGGMYVAQWVDRPLLRE